MESSVLKEGAVTKDIKRIKAEHASALGVQDFFTNRDKSKRKTSGLVEDSTQVIEEESKVKQELYDKSLEVNTLPEHIVPMFGGVFLTARRNKLMENGLYLPTASFGKGSDTDMDQDFSAEQIVLACGDHVNQLKPGYKVVLNLENFKKRLESSLAQKLNKEFEFVLPIEIIEGVEYLYVSERDVKYIADSRLA
tara:strand:+ start:1712 stop:2293 length:582 start_codon:yes stop_codon:yes gene_type:complete